MPTPLDGQTTASAVREDEVPEPFSRTPAQARRNASDAGRAEAQNIRTGAIEGQDADRQKTTRTLRRALPPDIHSAPDT